MPFETCVKLQHTVDAIETAIEGFFAGVL